MRARAWVAAAGVILVCALWAPVALAQVTAEDSVTGSARDCHDPTTCDFFVTSLTVDARSGPHGEDPAGQVLWQTVIRSVIDFRLPVSCLAVSGNTAIIGSDPFFGARALMRMTDGGGSAGADSFELVIEQNFGAPIPAADCSSFPPPPSPAGTFRFGDSGVNEFGDIVVHDAPPVPTSEDQCKNGGWRNYGKTFKNQGQCVAFVERGPKP